MNAQILSNQLVSTKFGYMELKCHEIASEPTAGKFFMLSVHSNESSLDPILKRPFAICDITSKDSFTFLYMIVGRGTAMLAKCVPGEKLAITGPLGNYFKLENNGRAALVAGGVGIAPIVLTAKRLKERGNKVTLFYGGKTASDIILREKLEPLCDEFIPVTDDGSLGIKGLVAAPFKERVKEFTKVYACGPNRMLMAVSDICVENGTAIDVSLDENMACGIGACLGCIINVKEKSGIVKKRCCVEGPVFDGSKIDWPSLCR